MPARTHLCVYLATSLDGYIAREDGSIDWLECVHVEGEDYGYKAFFDSVDVLVLGRKTYDTVAAFEAWPYEDKRCLVLTHQPPLAQHNEEFVDGDVRELVAQLGREGARRIYIDGAAVIQQFWAAGLVDELTISLVPIALGGGVRLFAGGELERSLRLERCQSWPSGLVQLRYALV